PDGKWLAYWIGSQGDDFLPPAGKIYVVPVSGGAARQLCAEFASAAFPVWSPDGRRLLFEGAREKDSFDWWTVSLADGKAARTSSFEALARNNLRLPPGHRGAAWVPGKLVFAAMSGDNINLWQMEMPGKTPQRLTLGSS